MISYDPLSHCMDSGAKLREVHHHTPGSDQYDVLFFDAANETQAARAARYSKRAIAYQPALINDPAAGGPDQWQVIARMAQIPCLPARFHFTYIDSKRFISIRTGEKAWEE